MPFPCHHPPYLEGSQVSVMGETVTFTLNHLKYHLNAVLWPSCKKLCRRMHVRRRECERVPLQDHTESDFSLCEGEVEADAVTCSQTERDECDSLVSGGLGDAFRESFRFEKMHILAPQLAVMMKGKSLHVQQCVGWNYEIPYLSSLIDLPGDSDNWGI